MSPGVPESQGKEINPPPTSSSSTNVGRKRKAREEPTENIPFEGPGKSLIAAYRRARDDPVPSHLNRAERLLRRKAKQQDRLQPANV